MTENSQRNSSGLYTGIKQRQELIGMIEGVLADDAINIHEAAHLATWLRQHRYQIGHAFDGIADELDDVLADGKITPEEDAQLRRTLQAALEHHTKNNTDDLPDDFTRRLIGFLKGVTADHVINDDELASLLRLLPDEYHCTPIVETVRHTVEHYAGDRAKLWRSLCAIAGHDPKSGVVSGLAMGGIFDDPALPSDISFEGATFCLTGTFAYGKRALCAERITNLGGQFHKHITKKTDYLVIGTLETKAWIGTNYGRKIESALGAKSKGSNIRIISESAWNAAAERMESSKKKYSRIDPGQHFSEWAYRPRKAHFPAFGIETRNRYAHWMIGRPVDYDFHVGDLFWHRDKNAAIQIVHDGEPLEVHSNQSGTWAPYHLTAMELAHWLRTGIEPTQHRIPASRCRHEIDRLRLKDDG